MKKRHCRDEDWDTLYGSAADPEFDIAEMQAWFAEHGLLIEAEM